MTENRTTAEPKATTDALAGGITITWILGRKVHSYVGKKDGKTRTIVELRDPACLGNSITLFLDGDSGALESVKVHTSITLRLDELRAGNSPGALTGSVAREVVEAAFAEASK